MGVHSVPVLVHHKSQIMFVSLPMRLRLGVALRLRLALTSIPALGRDLAGSVTR